MSKWIIIGVLVVVVIAGIGTYNGLVSKSEAVNSKFATIENYLQRRGDLIPNVVNSVKGYAKQELDVINAVTDARAKLSGASTMSEKAEADAELSNAISRLLVVVENYPELKSDRVFMQLIDELAGTENRIATARKDYNDAVERYNASIKKFPNNIFAGMFGLEAKEYFKASEGSKVVPNVEF